MHPTVLPCTSHNRPQTIISDNSLSVQNHPIWETLKNSNETTYTLISRHSLSSSTIDKLRHNKPLNTTTLNDLKCRILDCRIQDIVVYIPSENDQFL